MTQMDCAINLAKKGFHVFPLVANTKLAAIKDYPNLASRDPEQIRKWWVDPVLGTVKPFNVGISTTHFADDESLVVVDVDNKGTKKGDEELLRLEMDGFDLPPTMEQITPTGGRHLIYRSKESVKQGVDKLGKGLDVRAKGGYIVGAGSVLDNGEYTLIERDILPSPHWLISRLGQAIEKQIALSTDQKTDVDPVRARARSIQYLEKEAPQSVKGEGGDHTAYKVAARVKDFGVDAATCLELMMTAWHNGCGWSASRLKEKIDHAYRYGLQTLGVASPESEFTKVIPPELSYLHKMNAEYALVFLESSHAILHETVDEKGRRKRSFMQEQSFKRKFSPKTIQGNRRGKAPTWAEEWLDWPDRREYAGLCFTPEREPKHNYYNLWRGFTVEPLALKDATASQKKGFEMFLSHAKDNVCGGDEKLFQWLMGYFAHLVQRPYERPLTTLVFKGEKGTGKNALIDRVGRLLGPTHYLVAHDGRYLTSNFNGHMDSCLMLVLDEAFWSGDKAAEGKLKGLTTATEIMIERKGKEPYMVDNLVRLVVIGNEDWLVPASQDERRYAVFQMGSGMKQNRDFFRQMRVHLDEEGGSGLLLDYLQHFNLNTIDVNDAPKTAALLEQKQKSASSLEQYWFESLEEGIILQSDFQEEWPDRISKDSFYRAFTVYCKSRNINPKFADSEKTVGRKLKKICPSLDNHQKTKGSQRSNAYALPSLDQARKEYEIYIGHEVKWT